jgi:uncharacterized membrane protein affecting hemolysin expression
MVRQSRCLSVVDTAENQAEGSGAGAPRTVFKGTIASVYSAHGDVVPSAYHSVHPRALSVREARGLSGLHKSSNNRVVLPALSHSAQLGDLRLVWEAAGHVSDLVRTSLRLT